MGFFFAGLLHILLGEKYIKKHFGHSGVLSTIKAALFGIPLPVCSCAVIPLAESIRRDGASRSAVMAFLVSTPSSGVDSILATYALMGPVYALFRPIASFVSGIMVGLITHFKGGSDKPPVADQQKQNKPKKKPDKSFKEVMTYGFKVIPGEISKSLLLGVLIGGAISAVVPADFGTTYLLGSPVLNYVVILLISIPLYICATGSIPIAAALITKGLLPGAALALLIAGPATNSVTIAFVYKKLGKRTAILYVLSISITAVLTGLLFDALISTDAAAMKFVTATEDAHFWEIFKIGCAVLLAYVFFNAKYDLNLWNYFKKIFNRSETMANTHTITVPDMTCQHCQMTISKSLEQMPEVQSVEIDLTAKKVTVHTDASRDHIVARIKEDGYSPQ